MKKIYAYYTSIPQSNQGEEFACANWWKQSWTEQGWEPIMLNRSHAQASNLYNKLQQKLMQTAMGLPPELTVRFNWLTARIVRWCALHAAGGGWMSDYDVVNKGLKPEKAEKYEKDNTLHINCGEPAYIFYATQEHAANAIKKFIQEPLVQDVKVIDEAHILGVVGELYPITKNLHHAKESKDKAIPRSLVMKNKISKEK